jgi:hypothetical protein
MFELTSRKRSWQWDYHVKRKRKKTSHLFEKGHEFRLMKIYEKNKKEPAKPTREISVAWATSLSR